MLYCVNVLTELMYIPVIYRQADEKVSVCGIVNKQEVRLKIGFLPNTKSILSLRIGGGLPFRQIFIIYCQNYTKYKYIRNFCGRL
jgi:hypothetical protein